MEMMTNNTVRHIDELGRIIIPREIRKELRIKKNNALEIHADVENKTVYLKLKEDK